MRRRVDPDAMKKHGNSRGNTFSKVRQNRDISNAGAFNTMGAMKLNERSSSSDNSE